MLEGKKILLIVTGGIAAYKSPDLVRRLRERGAAVRCVLTAGGAEFVTALALGAVSRAAGKLGQDAAVEVLIRAGLSELAPVDVKGSA